MSDFKVGDTVTYSADPRIGGRVVGFGHVDAAAARLDGPSQDVVLVSLDQPVTLPGSTDRTFIMPFSASMLRRFLM